MAQFHFSFISSGLSQAAQAGTWVWGRKGQPVGAVVVGRQLES